MEMLEIMRNRRTCRRFDGQAVTLAQAETLMEMARIAPSAANRQPMRYCAAVDPAQVKKIHPLVHWAGYTAPLGGPGEGEEPSCYIALLADTDVKQECAQDEGIAGAAITYAAEAMGLASCWMGAIERPEISKILGVPEKWKLLSVIALGYPAQERVLETSDDVHYWLEGEVLHVPKRPREKVMFVDRVK